MKRRDAAPVLVLLTIAVVTGCGAPSSGRPVAELWSEHCASCHGEDGHGNPARRRLDPRIDLRRSEMISRDDRGLVFQRIAYGYAAMPGFIHKLPQGDIEKLVELCATLARR